MYIKLKPKKPANDSFILEKLEHEKIQRAKKFMKKEEKER